MGSRDEVVEVKGGGDKGWGGQGDGGDQGVVGFKGWWGSRDVGDGGQGWGDGRWYVKGGGGGDRGGSGLGVWGQGVRVVHQKG